MAPLILIHHLDLLHHWFEYTTEFIAPPILVHHLDLLHHWF